MKLNFRDNNLHLKLAPLTLTRPVAEIRFGILTISESWRMLLNATEFGYTTEKYLSEKFPELTGDDVIQLAGNIKPDKAIAEQVKKLGENTKLISGGRWIAQRGNGSVTCEFKSDNLIFIDFPWQVFQKNGDAIKADFEIITHGRSSNQLEKSNRRSEKGHVFIEEGARISNCILNAEDGPIYIGKDAEIMDGAMIRGPFALCSHATVKMGAKIYGPTTVGPECKVGGEISNSVFQAYSNKGHDGFVGNSYIGEWCNLGADTNSSNLMNTYAKLKIHSFETGRSEQTDVTFCGVLMGDHTKTGINTMLNTATVTGVSANIFGAGFPDKYIPSFTWGAAEDSEKFRLDKAFEVATNMMARRNVILSMADRRILEHLFQLAQ